MASSWKRSVDPFACGPFSSFCTLYSVVGRCHKWRTPWRFHHIDLRESPGLRHKGVHEEHSTRKERILQARWDDRGQPRWKRPALDRQSPWLESFAGVAGFKSRILKLKIMGGSVPANIPQDSSRVQSARFYIEFIHMECLLREWE